MTDRVPRALLALLVLALLGGGGAAAGQPAGTLSKSALRRALFSVYLYAQPDAERLLAELPEAFQALDLLRATKILSDDRSDVGRSRRIRAAAKLASAGIQPPRYPDALAALGLAGDLLLDVQRQLPPGATPRQIEQVVLLEMGWKTACTGIERTLPKTILDSPSSLTSVVVTFSVKRTIGALAVALDPQHWDECSPWFEKAYVAKPEGSSFPTDANHDATQESNPPAPGSAWEKVLFEHFEVDFATQKASFRNLLDIKTQRSPNRFYFRYDLHPNGSIWSEVPGFPPGPGGLQFDYGHLEVEEAPGAPGWVNLEATKHVEFTNPVVNAWAEIALLAMGEESWDSVCCVAPDRTLAPPGEPALSPP